MTWEEAQVIFAGIDWSETHHDVCVMDGAGQVLGRRRVAHSVQGIAELRDLVAEHAASGWRAWRSTAGCW